jgi:hypothetical protein
MVGSIVAMFLARSSPELRPYFGAIERVLCVAIIGWLTMIGLVCTLRIR